MGKPQQINLEEYTLLNNCTTNKNGGWTREQVELSALLRVAKAAEGINDGFENLIDLLTQTEWCSFRHAVEHMAYKHEHSLTFKFHWSIRWPWQQKARRRQRTWWLFKGRAKK